MELATMRRFMRPGGIVRALVELGSLTIVVRLTGMVKEALLARELGVSAQLDAFLLAFGVFTFVNAMLLQPYLSAQLPVWTKARVDSSTADADAWTGRTALRWMAFVVLLIAAGIIAAPLIVEVVAGGFDDAKQATTTTTLRILLLGLAFRAPAVHATTLLHAEQRFRVASLAPVAIPAVTIAALVPPGYDKTAQVLAVATIVGVLLESAALLIVARRRLPIRRFGKTTVQWEAAAHGDREFWSEYRIIVISAAVMGGAGLIDQAMAADLGGGSVSQLSLGLRVPAVFLNVVVLAVGTAVFPRFTDLVAAGEWRRLRVLVKRYNRAILTATAPVALALVVLSTPIVRLLFEGGDFGPDDTRTVSDVQRLYALQIPFYVSSTVGARVLSALQRNGMLIVIAVANLTLNIAGNLILIEYLGVKGIALSTAVVYGASTVLVLLAVQRDLGRRT